VQQPGRRSPTSPPIRPSLDRQSVADGHPPRSCRSSRSRSTQPVDPSGSTPTSTVGCNCSVSTMSAESTSKRRPSSSPSVSSPPEVNTDPVRGAAQPEVVSIYDGFMGQSSSTGQPCRGSHRTSGNQGGASSVTEPAVTSGASSPDAVPAEPEVEYRGAGSRGPVRSRPRGSSSFLATQQPPATVAYSSEQVPAALRSSVVTRTAGTCTNPGGAAGYSALPGLSSLQRAPGLFTTMSNVWICFFHSIACFKFLHHLFLFVKLYRLSCLSTETL